MMEIDFLWLADDQTSEDEREREGADYGLRVPWDANNLMAVTLIGRVHEII